jgi:hypothetical protein
MISLYEIYFPRITFNESMENSKHRFFFSIFNKNFVEGNAWKMNTPVVYVLYFPFSFVYFACSMHTVYFTHLMSVLPLDYATNLLFRQSCTLQSVDDAFTFRLFVPGEVSPPAVG